MATAKKTAAPKTLAEIKAQLNAGMKKPTKVSKSVAPKAVPAVLAKAGKQFGADAAGVPGSKKPTKAPKASKSALAVHNDSKAALLKPKRTVAVPVGGASQVPQHTFHDAASLAHVLGTFPRGATLDFMDDRLDVYNLRGRLIAEVRKGDKPAKTARADKL